MAASSASALWPLPPRRRPTPNGKNKPTSNPAQATARACAGCVFPSPAQKPVPTCVSGSRLRTNETLAAHHQRFFLSASSPPVNPSRLPPRDPRRAAVRVLDAVRPLLGGLLGATPPAPFTHSAASTRGRAVGPRRPPEARRPSGSGTSPSIGVAGHLAAAARPADARRRGAGDAGTPRRRTATGHSCTGAIRNRRVGESPHGDWQMLRAGRICSGYYARHAVSSLFVGPRCLFSQENPHCLECKCHGTNRTDDNNTKFLRPRLNLGSPGACFSTITETILVQARDPSQLALEIENAIDERRFDDAWRAYEKHVHMDGLPRKSVLSKLITGLAESCDAHWLNQSYNVVSHAFEEKHELLGKEPLIYLSLTLARCALPNLAINLMRKLVKMEAYPPVAAWSAVVAHMCQTNTGAFLAADLVMELGYLFQNNRVDPRKKSNRPLVSMKPNSFTFNIVLTASLLFGTTRKAEQLLELMPRIGVKPEVNLLIVMARIYERNGRRDEIQKLKRHVDEAYGLSESEFRQFYDCLLSCHLKFGDLDSAVDMVLDMLRKGNNAKRSLEAAKAVLEAVENRKLYFPYEKTEAENSCSSDKPISNSQMLSYVSFFKDNSFARLELEARELLKLLSDKLQEQVGLVKSEHGILHPTETMYAKLVKAFLEADKISALASFLVKASKEDSPVSVERSFVVQVINACISLGLLEQAHDLLDEMRFSGIRVGSSIYSSLLKAYCKEGQHEDDITALLKDAQQAGIQLDASCYEDLIQSRASHRNTTGALHLFKELKNSNVLKSGHKEFQTLVQGSDDSEAALTTRLVEEVRSGHMVDYAVHDWNSVIHFFCKKRLMHDAHRALNKMRASGHVPNAQTFHSLITAYAAIGGKYVEVTDLWGEMKVLAGSSSMKFDQELLDSLLYCFVRGGFFLRAMEVIEMMEKCEMFIDKYKYKSLWLKYHRTLYKGKAPKVQTEAQLKRREAAIHFKKWIGLT